MKENLRKNFGLIVAFALPILLILGVALSIYIPQFFVSTKYNFVYSVCSDNYYNDGCNKYLQKHFTVTDNVLSVNEVSVSDMYPNISEAERKYYNTNYSSRIFLHNSKTNESREISIDEAKKMKFDSLLTSPDGVTISNSYTGGGGSFFPFGGSGYSYGYYLMKGNSKSKLNLINDNDRYYYQNNFHLVGWVLSN